MERKRDTKPTQQCTSLTTLQKEKKKKTGRVEDNKSHHTSKIKDENVQRKILYANTTIITLILRIVEDAAVLRRLRIGQGMRNHPGLRGERHLDVFLLLSLDLEQNREQTKTTLMYDDRNNCSINKNNLVVRTQPLGDKS